LECGENVEKPKHVEVWRDLEAVEELIQVSSIKRGRENITIQSGTSLFKIPREIIHEKIVSIVRRNRSIYVKLLKINLIGKDAPYS